MKVWLRPPSLPRALLLAGVVAIAGSGCFLVAQEPTAVARAELYTTGTAEYDAFFADLHAVQIEMGSALDVEAAIRAFLAAKLELAAAAAGSPSASDLAAEVKQRAKALAQHGVELRADLTGEVGRREARAEVVVVSGDAKAAAALVEPTLRALADALALLGRMRATEAELQRLDAMADGLVRAVPATFSGASPKRRGEIRRHLADAQAVIPLMVARVREVDALASDLAYGLEDAATTASEAPKPATPPVVEADVPEATGAKGPSGAGRGTSPRAAPPRPASTPPPAKPAADFEP